MHPPAVKDFPASWNITSLLWHTCIWLLLPVFLFMTGWMHWYIGLPLTVFMAWGLGISRKTFRASRERRASGLPFPLLTWSSLAVLAGFILLMVISGWGEWCNQHPDHIVRNACLRELVASPWPVAFPDGDVLIYNIGFWLVPALIGKTAGLDAARVALPLWGAWGLYLSWLWLCVFGGRRSMSTALLLVLFGSLMNLQGLLDLDLVRLHYFGITEQIMCSSNAAIPVILFFTCLTSGRLPLSWLLILFATLAFYSPLAALGGLPLLLCQGIVQWKKQASLHSFLRLLPALAASLVLGICFLLYYANVNIPSSRMGFRLFYIHVTDIALIGSSFLIYAAFCWRDACRIPLFPTALATGLLLPFFYVYGDVNDLLCKGCVPVMACLLAFLSRTWEQHSKLRVWIAALLILGMAPRLNLPYYCCSTDALRRALQPQEATQQTTQNSWLNMKIQHLTYAPQAKAQTEWGNTMYHPGHRWYPYYSGTPKPAYRFIYRTAGIPARLPR